ncbi:MAG: ABC transporter substrate-binding protein [Ethanoligenens sp.]
MKKWLSLLAGAVALSVALSGCKSGSDASSGTADSHSAASRPAVTVRYGYVDGGKSVPPGIYGIGKNQGYFDAELKKVNATIQFIPFTGAGPAINSALAGNSLDIGNLGDVPALVAKASGVDTIAISGAISTTGAQLVVPAGSTATSIKDLKGKRVATQKGAFMHRVLLKMLQANGMTINDIQFVNMSGVVAKAAIVSKSIDAAVLPTANAQTVILGNGAKDILNGDEHPDWLSSGETVVLSDFAKKNPDVLVAFEKAVIESKNYADKHPEALRQNLLDTGLTEDVINATYPTKNYGSAIELDSKVIASLKDVDKFCVDNQVTQSSVNIDKWVDNSYYQKAYKALK